MRYSNFKPTALLTCILVCCIMLSGKAQIIPFYHNLSFKQEDYFTKTVFPFNPAFIKNHKIKSITLKNTEEIGRNYIYDFNPTGAVVSMTAVNYTKEKIDTAFYTRYYYNLNGMIDKKAQIDYRDGIVKISSYHYDEKNRVAAIRIFSLNSQMPDRLQNSDWQGEPLPGVDKMILQSILPDESLFNTMTAENAFSSWRYRYYTENKFDAEERTEYFDFQKNNDNQDTCQQKKTYYYLNGLPVALFLHNDCDEKKNPIVHYQFKEGLLSSITDTGASLEPRNEKYNYDKNKNLVLMDDIWNGQKVSELIMTYDKRGFLTTIQRKSDIPKMVDYFEDRILMLTYSFY